MRGFLFEFMRVVWANFGRLSDWHVVQTELLEFLFSGLTVLVANQTVEVRNFGPCLLWWAILVNFMNIEKVVLPFEGCAICRRFSTADTHCGMIPVTVTMGIRE